MSRNRLAFMCVPLVVAGVALASSPDTALADPPAAPQAESPETTAKMSEAFSVLHAVNQTSTEFSKMAEKRAKSDLVKDYAKSMAAANAKADEKLLRIGKQKGLKVGPLDTKNPISKSLMDRMKAEKVMLNSLEGDAFDKSYMTLVTNTQQSVIRLLEKQKTNAKDDEVKQYLGELIGIVQGRLDKSQDVMAKIYGDNV
ncbi:MAG: DUF4142 domain-containing protein [Polyangiaceae bacterium]|nr:DUF4142 domain-containing protein [Polyangiaceae bacterium]